MIAKSLLIASQNPGKIAEIQSILAPLRFNILSARELEKTIHVEETGETYAQNARLKAATFLQKTGIPALADDTGLAVDALGGAPGVFSARYSPKANATDADRRDYLLSQLKFEPQPWKAHFQCVVVLATPAGEFFETVGRCDGMIIPEERGSGGFGYDPIFFMPEYQMTMAELTTDLKNKISHRAKALVAMMGLLKTLFDSQ